MIIIMESNRFRNESEHLKEFQNEVAVYCPSCNKKALATVNNEDKTAKLLCSQCGYNKITDTRVKMNGGYQTAAMDYFDADLWYIYPFKNETFWAYNDAHLEYLQNDISEKIKESKNSSYFTLLEKLPLFYNTAKNNQSLLNVIDKLKVK
ncbi:hypothetical protein CHRY9393_02869 [Chryseobacterium fistulae]|uniref:TFIIB-type zinc ribbon-containing protein n=2 Tax=Chryseobacterium fistulae TaxID=2675058 RepID=A0A6N4XZD6_9FLAO|nr:hypothetical protein CHRY9393_02869 [Chryseobacterium fistulae]